MQSETERVRVAQALVANLWELWDGVFGLRGSIVMADYGIYMMHMGICGRQLC